MNTQGGKHIRWMLEWCCTGLIFGSSLVTANAEQKSVKHKQTADALMEGFQRPPAAARLRCYWWWLNGHTTEATITRDLEEMSKKGYGGALLVDANGADQDGNDNVPAGPEFGSPAWTKLYIHALKEADRLGLEITLNITSGWNLGGPEVKPENASKLLTWSRVIAEPGSRLPLHLDMPPTKNGFYKPIAVLAYPLANGAELAGEAGSHRKALRGLEYKSAAAEMGFSMPDADFLLTDDSPGNRDEDMQLSQVRDISNQVDADGTVRWVPPADNHAAWEILRIGYTDSDARLSTSSGNWQGLAIDYLDPASFDGFWNANVEPLLSAARPYVGKSLKYVATDSWELGGTNWTGAFRDEFIKRRGYDPLLYLPAMTGRIVDSRETSTHFLTDIRRTVADLVNSHYDRMAVRAKAYGLGTECESGGPHGAPFDALETFRSSAVPQTEYWAMSKEHRTRDSDRFFVKEAASAAHIYGRPFSAAEGMTSIGNQWSESLGMNLRPSFDQALTEGMNRLVWHEFTSSPPELGLPGQEYFAGTHLNPNVTWWRDADTFFQYLNRSQFLLQQGLPVNDLLYYYGDNVPNFVRLKSDDPARVLPGYDYDVTDTDALLRRFTFAGGALRTTEGIRYRALALPVSRIFPLSVLKFMERYAEAGGTLIGERPLRSPGIVSAADELSFQKIVRRLWSSCETSADHHVSIGMGSLYCTTNSHDALVAMGVAPDMQEVEVAKTVVDYVHRRTADADIYFIRNTTNMPVVTNVMLRVGGRQPEFFHADTGAIKKSLLFKPTSDGRTLVPLTLEARGSVFVILRGPSSANYVTSLARNGKLMYDSGKIATGSLPGDFSVEQKNGAVVLSGLTPGVYDLVFSNGTKATVSAEGRQTMNVAGPWTLSFPGGWGAPSHVEVGRLRSWTEFDDPGIRYFSGRATYRTTLLLTDQQAITASSSVLKLGDVHEVAAVRINGKDAGVVWKAPYALEVGGLLHAGENLIEVDVTNLWPNRLIGDAQDPNAKHYTWTNIRKYTKVSPLLPSGMMGPVTLEPRYVLPVNMNPH
jgi:hypothetical protein